MIELYGINQSPSPEQAPLGEQNVLVLQLSEQRTTKERLRALVGLWVLPVVLVWLVGRMA